MLPVSVEKKPFSPPTARESRSVGTDGRRFWRNPAPALPTVGESRAARRPPYRRPRFSAHGRKAQRLCSGLHNLGQNPPSLLSQSPEGGLQLLGGVHHGSGALRKPVGSIIGVVSTLDIRKLGIRERFFVPLSSRCWNSLIPGTLHNGHRLLE